MSLSKMFKEMIKIEGEIVRTDMPIPDLIRLPRGVMGRTKE
jgi:hypothetical protein